MAVTTPRHLPGVLLGATPTLVMTVPADQSFTFRSIICTNNAGSAKRLWVWLVPAGGTPDDTHAICNGLMVPGPGQWGDDSPHVLEEGGMLYGQSETAGAFNCVADGAENT